MTPITCPECGDLNWRQDEHYHATDRNYLFWNQEHQTYDFSYALKATSDHDREVWVCSNDHIAPEEAQAALDEMT